ncbi:hypothetical protein DFH09DRAFT_1108602 [Mycena vulgaris]|nr:hypothetical protein DFH09DRAFT_1108602 [Mycena vulgaris]
MSFLLLDPADCAPLRVGSRIQQLESRMLRWLDPKTRTPSGLRVRESNNSSRKLLRWLDLTTGAGFTQSVVGSHYSHPLCICAHELRWWDPTARTLRAFVHANPSTQVPKTLRQLDPTASALFPTACGHPTTQLPKVLQRLDPAARALCVCVRASNNDPTTHLLFAAVCTKDALAVGSHRLWPLVWIPPPAHPLLLRAGIRQPRLQDVSAVGSHYPALFQWLNPPGPRRPFVCGLPLATFFPQSQWKRLQLQLPRLQTSTPLIIKGHYSSDVLPPQFSDNIQCRHKTKILAKAAQRRAIAKEAKTKKILVTQDETTDDDDDSDSSYADDSSVSSRSTVSTVSHISHASSDAEPVDGTNAVMRGLHSVLPANEHLAVLAQDADLWASKWGGIAGWIHMEHSEHLVPQLDTHRERGRTIIGDLRHLAYGGELPLDHVWLG